MECSRSRDARRFASLPVVLLTLFLSGCHSTPAPAPGPAVTAPSDRHQETRLWYDHPATDWETQALPIGNGRLGAMVFGGIASERIQLNEDTLWAGGPRDCNNPAALEHLEEIRRLLFAGKPGEAFDLADKYAMGNPRTLRPYQTLGDLRLTLPGHEDAVDYRRELDLDTGIVRVSYRVGETRYTREIFASHPDQVIVMRFTCSKPGG